MLEWLEHEFGDDGRIRIRLDGWADDMFEVIDRPKLKALKDALTAIGMPHVLVYIGNEAEPTL